MKPKFQSIRTEQEQRELFDLAEKLEQVSRMVKHLAKSNDRSEPVYAGVLRERLPEAWAALAIIENRFGDDNTGEQPRFSNDHYAEAAKAAGGVFVISKEADPIETARQLVASGSRGRLETELGLYEQADRIITETEAQGHTVGRNIHYQRASSLAWIKRAVRESEIV